MKYQRPEDELVVLCSRVRLSDAAQSRLNTLLGQPLDWDYCLNFARHHRVTALLCYHMERLSPPNLPPARHAMLKAWYHRHSFRNLFLTAELLKTQRIFQGYGIPMLTVKGPVLSKLVYGDVTLREYADIDLVVKVNDISRLKEALLNTGYYLDAATALEKDSIYMRSHYNFPFSHQSGLFNLEVHWRLWETEFESWLPTEEIWDHTEQVFMSDTESVTTLGGHYLLIYLCTHGAKHQWSRLSWICDVNELLSSDIVIDWAALTQVIRHARNTRMVLLGLVLARDLLGAPLPDSITELIVRDRQLPLLAEQAFVDLFAQKEQSNELGYYLRLRENWIDKVVHVLRFAGREMVPSSYDTNWVRLPRSLYFLYFLARPVRLFLGLFQRRRVVDTESMREKT